jgi:hypothetical protein
LGAQAVHELSENDLVEQAAVGCAGHLGGYPAAAAANRCTLTARVGRIEA